MLTPQKAELIAGRYRLVREIARGGMGSVWEGEDGKLKRRVAVKLVATDLHEESETRAAHAHFEREAMAVAKLQSPHVVQIFDYGVDRDRPYIVMELLEGVDLRTRLHHQKRIALDSAAIILVQTAKALSVAHAAGIVHRDLKPGNVFLVRAAEEEIIKVLDFGVAMQATDLLEHDGEIPVLGTPQFMSPEQARGLPDLDHRADLWSLGVIVYKALTGRLPFNGGSPTDVIVKVCTTDPEPVSKLAPDLPRELDEFFDKALARDRRQRFSSAREMALAFSRISPVNFTTLSMPDPTAIQEAIALAREKAIANGEVVDIPDDEAATMAVDLGDGEDAATVMLGNVLDDLKTSMVIPPAASSLPKPTPPPRRSGAGTSDKPPEKTGPPGKDAPPPMNRPRPAAGRPPVAIPAPTPPPSREPVFVDALDYDDDKPTAVPGSSGVPTAPPSSPMLLSRPEEDTGLSSDTPPAVVGSLPATAMTSPGTPPRKRATRNTLLMALAAALLGVTIAVVASQMTSETDVLQAGDGVDEPRTPRAKKRAPVFGAAGATSPEEAPSKDEGQSVDEELIGAAEAAPKIAARPAPARARRRAPTQRATVQPVAVPDPTPDPAPTAAPDPVDPEPVKPAPVTPAPAKPAPVKRRPAPVPDDPFAERL